MQDKAIRDVSSKLATCRMFDLRKFKEYFHLVFVNKTGGRDSAAHAGQNCARKPMGTNKKPSDKRCLSKTQHITVRMSSRFQLQATERAGARQTQLQYNEEMKELQVAVLVFSSRPNPWNGMASGQEMCRFSRALQSNRRNVRSTRSRRSRRRPFRFRDLMPDTAQVAHQRAYIAQQAVLTSPPASIRSEQFLLPP